MMSSRRLRKRSLCLAALLLVLSALSASADVSPRVEFLRELRGDILARGTGAVEAATRAASTASSLAELAPAVAVEDVFTGSVRFAEAPSADDFARLRALGLLFRESGGQVLGSRTVFPASIPFAALDEAAALDFVANIACAWRPAIHRPLARSRPQIEAEQAWQVASPLGGTLSGAGVTICDIDTGVYFRHMAFYRSSGELYNWIDSNSSGDFDSGDAVDLNGNDVADANERLAWVEASATDQYGNTAGFDADFDFIFNDADWDGTRDFGPPDYDESDPCYGEQIFRVVDGNGNGALDAGEQLDGLDRPMMRAIYNKDGSIYHRDVDLLDSEADGWGHGTQVSGIFGCGARGRAMAGIAPGVESLHVNYDFFNEPPFLMPIEDGLAWAVAEGADMVLIEDGEWTWEYMDGSSNIEIMMNEYAAEDGMIFVVPAGNLATGHMHTLFSSVEGCVLQHIGGAAYSWPNFIWTDPVDLSISMTTPGGHSAALPGDGSFMELGGYRIYSQFSISERGTRRMDLRLTTSPVGGSVAGDWVFTFSDGAVNEIHGFFVDSASGWSSQSHWSEVVQTHTVTWPATADSAISIAAYNPMEDGDLNGYSGWGPRIDGRPNVDIAAPGGTVVSASPWNETGYSSFGGTSSAGPHVAGAVALLRELLPELDSGLCRRALWIGAGQDEFTDDPDRWGAGKLRIMGAIASIVTEVAETVPHPELALSAWPNPFNPTTTIEFAAPAAGSARLRVFTVEGREVWSEAIRVDTPGRQTVVWHGIDDEGNSLPSAVYFAHVRVGERVAATKLTLLK